MSVELGQFDATGIAPRTAPEPIPTDWYYAVITDSEMKATNDTKGAFLMFTFAIIHGQYEKRKLVDRLNIVNDNPTAVEIAYGTLSAICHATGVMKVPNTSVLHNIPLQIKVIKTPPTERFPEGTNEIKGYRSVAQAAGAAAAPSAPAVAVAPPAQPVATPAPAFTPPAAPPVFVPPAAPATSAAPPVFNPPVFTPPGTAAAAPTPPWLTKP